MSLENALGYLMNEAPDEEVFAISVEGPAATAEGKRHLGWGEGKLCFLLEVGECRDMWDEWAKDDHQSLENVYDGVMTALNDADVKAVMAGTDEEAKGNLVADVQLGVLLRAYFGSQVDAHLPFTFKVVIDPDKALDPQLYLALQNDFKVVQ